MEGWEPPRMRVLLVSTTLFAAIEFQLDERRRAGHRRAAGATVTWSGGANATYVEVSSLVLRPHNLYLQ